MDHHRSSDSTYATANGVEPPSTTSSASGFGVLVFARWLVRLHNLTNSSAKKLIHVE